MVMHAEASERSVYFLYLCTSVKPSYTMNVLLLGKPLSSFKKIVGPRLYTKLHKLKWNTVWTTTNPSVCHFFDHV